LILTLAFNVKTYNDSDYIIYVAKYLKNKNIKYMFLLKNKKHKNVVSSRSYCADWIDSNHCGCLYVGVRRVLYNERVVVVD